MDAMNERYAVLIVDDDAEIQAALATLFTEEGYQVFRASDGAHALAQLAQTRQPLAVLLDLTMPVMDGFAVCRRLAADPALRRDHAIVLMTAHGRLQHLDLSVADAVIAKPFDIEALLAIVERLAQRVRAQSARRWLGVIMRRRPRAAWGSAVQKELHTPYAPRRASREPATGARRPADHAAPLRSRARPRARRTPA